MLNRLMVVLIMLWLFSLTLPLACVAEGRAASKKLECQESQGADIIERYEGWRDYILSGQTVPTENWQIVLASDWQKASELEGVFQQELRQRAIQDQFLRYSRFWEVDHFLNLLGVTQSNCSTEQIGSALIDYSHNQDSNSAAWIRKKYEAQGSWFRSSEIGQQAADDALLLVQHAILDEELMHMVLLDLQEYILTNDADPAGYAKLYDRVQMLADRPQRFGTQFVCEAGEYQAYRLEDAATVDEVRASIGLNTLKENASRFKDMKCQ